MKNNEFLLSAVYQFNIGYNAVFPNVGMSLDLPSRKRIYFFLFSGLFNKYETRCGTAFEAIFNRAVLNDLKEMKLEIIIGKKLSFEWYQVNGITHGFSKLTSLINSCNIAFGKLLIPILSAVTKTVLNVKKLLGLYLKLLQQNGAEQEIILIRLPKEWKK